MEPGGLLAHIRIRAQHISPREACFVGVMGFVIALLSIPILNNIGIPALLSAHGVSFALVASLWALSAPLLLVAAAYALTMLPVSAGSAAQLSRYAVIGCFNVALNASIFNLLILVTGISAGPMVTVFAVITFVIVVTQSFFWSVFWTFRNAPAQNRKRQYVRFFGVSSVVAAVNIGIIYFMTSVIGAPSGISGPLWANIALLVTIFTALAGNFLGYKLFVFRA